MSNIKIFVSHHKEGDTIIDNPLYVNVRGGAALSGEQGYEQTDGTGDNISRYNKTLNELTIQYWAWKNIEADYYGLCHYRRYISFSDEWFPYPEKRNIKGASEHCLNASYIDEYAIKRFGLSESAMRREIESCDVIVSDPIDVNRDYGFISNLSMLENIPRAYKMNDYKVLMEVIQEKYPDYYEDALEVMNGRIGYFYNCFVMKKEVFNDYCQWLFDILLDLQSRLDMTYYWVHLLRTPGHLSERLLTLYICRLHKEKKYKIKEKQLVFFEYPEREEILKPAFDYNNIPILFSATQVQVPYLTVAIRSLLEHASAANNYDIIVFGNDILVDDKKDIQRMSEDISNISIRFYDPKRHIYRYEKELNEVQGNLENFYKACSPYVLLDYEKIVWLNENMVIEKDVAELYKEELGDMIAGFVKDIWISAFANDSRNREKYEYLNDSLSMKNVYDYVNMGVGLVDLKKFRNTYTLDKIMELACSQKFMFNEACVLNILLEGHVQFLDRRWNVIGMNNSLPDWAPADDYYVYLDSRNDPFIVQYKGTRPWRNPLVSFSDLFWKYARLSPKYEVILSDMMSAKDRTTEKRVTEELLSKITLKKRISRAAKQVFKMVFPYGSQPYVKIKAAYFKVRGWEYNPAWDLKKL